jgi:hypothetical protein
MPIITCTDCSNEMSDSAPACPNCGKPNTNIPRKERSVSFILGLGILLIPVIFSWFTLRKGHTTKAKVISFAWLFISFAIIIGSENDTTAPPATSTNSTSSPAQEVIQVSASDLVSAYRGNEIGADNKYKDNIVQITGVVSGIGKDIFDTPYITLGAGARNQHREVQAYFDDSMNNQLGQLKRGSSLTITCRVKGLMMNVQAEDCLIK